MGDSVLALIARYGDYDRRQESEIERMYEQSMLAASEEWENKCKEVLAELKHLVRLLEPMEQAGTLTVPGLATLNGPRRAIAVAEGKL